MVRTERAKKYLGNVLRPIISGAKVKVTDFKDKEKKCSRLSKNSPPSPTKATTKLRFQKLKERKYEPRILQPVTLFFKHQGYRARFKEQELRELCIHKPATGR